VDESFYGIKTHYDQLEDLSDEKATADEKVWERQLADLKKNIKFEVLDAQTQLSYKLFEREAAREGKEFKYRFDIYPVRRDCLTTCTSRRCGRQSPLGRI
jgi:uncharacterized protein (DUF885 family)